MSRSDWIPQTVTTELIRLRKWYAEGLFRDRVVGIVRDRLAPIYIAILEELGAREALEA